MRFMQWRHLQEQLTCHSAAQHPPAAAACGAGLHHPAHTRPPPHSCCTAAAASAATAGLLARAPGWTQVQHGAHLHLQHQVLLHQLLLVLPPLHLPCRRHRPALLLLLRWGLGVPVLQQVVQGCQQLPRPRCWTPAAAGLAQAGACPCCCRVCASSCRHPPSRSGR